MRLQHAKFYLARINLVYLLTGSHTASVKIRVSQDFHYLHFGPDTSFLRGDYHVNSRKFISIPHPFSSCGNQKCLQTWSNIPLGLKSSHPPPPPPHTHRILLTQTTSMTENLHVCPYDQVASKWTISDVQKVIFQIANQKIFLIQEMSNNGT